MFMTVESLQAQADLQTGAVEALPLDVVIARLEARFPG